MEKDRKWAESSNYVLLVSENYMEEILKNEGFSDIYDEEGIDSTLVCEYAIWELGFQNLGDFGNGLVFMKDREELEAEFIDKYFS